MGNGDAQCDVCKQETSSWERFDYPESAEYVNNAPTDAVITVCPACIRRKKENLAQTIPSPNNEKADAL